MFTGAIQAVKNNHSVRLFQTASKPQQVIEKNKNTDTVTISAKGKNNHLLQGLMEQKTRLTESKNKLMGDALEQGTPMEAIQAQLESYEEQIEQIDKQIEKLSAVPEEEKAQNTYTKPKNMPKQSTQNSTDMAFLQADTALENAKTVFAQAEKTEQQADILKIEIKQDKQLSAGLEGSEKMIDKKEEKLEELEELKENNQKQLEMTTRHLEQTNDELSETDNKKIKEKEQFDDTEQKKK